jgi:hypothetical protein
VPECTSCGTCCFSELDVYIRVFGIDLDRMDDRAQAFTHFISNRCYMRIDDGRCTALVVDPIARTFKCSIYEMRPDVCRSLERGSGNCRADLHDKAGRPDVLVARLLAKLAP